MATHSVTASGSSKTRKQGTPAPNKQSASKSDLVLRALKRKSGATMEELCMRTGWQAHSVRGFLSGTVRKKLGHEVVRQKDATGRTHYFIGKSGSVS